MPREVCSSTTAIYGRCFAFNFKKDVRKRGKDLSSPFFRDCNLPVNSGISLIANFLNCQLVRITAATTITYERCRDYVGLVNTMTTDSTSKPYQTTSSMVFLVLCQETTTGTRQHQHIDRITPDMGLLPTKSQNFIPYNGRAVKN